MDSQMKDKTLLTHLSSALRCTHKDMVAHLQSRQFASGALTHYAAGGPACRNTEQGSRVAG